jgi:Flp pilus assembly protein TadD
VWLLSATLSRRLGDLTVAQAQIETAATLDGNDPAIALEAGVIAELAGNEDAARKSWQSVVAVAPSSPEATSAKAYLAQIGGGQ